jgi:hypothetical protein
MDMLRGGTGKREVVVSYMNAPLPYAIEDGFGGCFFADDDDDLAQVLQDQVGCWYMFPFWIGWAYIPHQYAPAIMWSLTKHSQNNAAFLCLLLLYKLGRMKFLDKEYVFHEIWRNLNCLPFAMWCGWSLFSVHMLHLLLDNKYHVVLRAIKQLCVCFWSSTLNILKWYQQVHLEKQFLGITMFLCFSERTFCARREHFVL